MTKIQPTIPNKRTFFAISPHYPALWAFAGFLFLSLSGEFFYRAPGQRGPRKENQQRGDLVYQDERHSQIASTGEVDSKSFGALHLLGCRWVCYVGMVCTMVSKLREEEGRMGQPPPPRIFLIARWRRGRSGTTPFFGERVSTPSAILSPIQASAGEGEWRRAGGATEESILE